MTNELFNKWVAALRSGEYKQTRLVLQDQNGFCCLGVLCDLLDPEAWGQPIEWDVEYFLWKGQSRQVPPLWWNSFCPIVEQDQLAKLNDSGTSFREIADYLEEHKAEFVQ